jgi:hypothetical protein
MRTPVRVELSTRDPGECWNTPGAWPNLTERFDVPKRTCSIEGCTGEAGVPGSTKDLCRPHYTKKQRQKRKLPQQRLSDCVECGASLAGLRADARFCSRRCGERARVRALGDVERRRRHEYYMAHREQHLANCRRRYQENREAAVAYRRRYYARTKAERAEYRRAYHRATRERKATYDRKYRDANRIRLAANKSQWKKARRDVIVAKRRAYYASNMDKYAVWAHNRRAMKLANPHSVGVSHKDWLRTLRRYRGRCAYCGSKPDVIHMDHVVPLARGGRHAIGNLVPACASCNCSKGGRFVMEWRIQRMTLEVTEPCRMSA